MAEDANISRTAREELKDAATGICMRLLAQKGLGPALIDGVGTARIACRDDHGTTVLVQVRAYVQEEAGAMPPIGLEPEEYAELRRATLLYAADHEELASVRHDVMAVALGEGGGALRHLIGAYSWEE